MQIHLNLEADIFALPQADHDEQCARYSVLPAYFTSDGQLHTDVGFHDIQRMAVHFHRTGRRSWILPICLEKKRCD